MHATDARDGIDHCSTNNSTTCAVQSISIPILIAAMGGYRFVRDDEVIFEKAASRDKDAPSPQRTCTFAIRDGGR